MKQDIDKARDQLASTVDSLAVRANPADSPWTPRPGDRLRQEARGGDLAGRDCSTCRRFRCGESATSKRDSPSIRLPSRAANASDARYRLVTSR